MFLPSKFYIHKENDQLIEFREKKLNLYAGSLFLTILGLSCLYLFFSTEQSGWKAILLTGIGISPIILGVVSILTIGRVLIDRQKKSLYFYGGVRKFLFSPVTISFSDISHIEIKEGFKYRYGAGGATWDIILLKRHGHNDIEIDHSRNDEYVNKMTYKISQYVECGVHHDRL